MIGQRLRIAMAAVAMSCAIYVNAQERTETLAYFTTTASGQAAVHIECSGTNVWGNNQNNPVYYAGIEAACQVTDPDGNTIFNGDGGAQESTSDTYNFQIPITKAGTYQVNSQYYVYYIYSENDQAWEDPNGYIDDGLQSLDLSMEYDVYGSGDYEDVNGAYFQFAESNGSITLDELDVETSPQTVTLEGGKTQVFTATVAGTSYNGVTWTISPSGVGVGTMNGNSYSYTAPASITTGQDITLRACSTYLPTICSTSVISLLAGEGISVSLPSPNVLFADGSSTADLNAYITNGPENASVTWSPPPPTITTTGAATATYMAPQSASAFPAGSASPTSSVMITATIAGSDPEIKATTNLTLVQPVSITGALPASLAAGSRTTITITGGGLLNGTVSVSSPGYAGVTFTQGEPTSTPNSTIQGTLFIPLNTTNLPASQPITLTVSATNGGLTSPAVTSSPISIIFASYTYTLTLTSTAPTLTYGSMAAITPHVTCKTSTGAACPSGVPNPQTANFSLISGVGSLSATSNAASTNYTASTMVGTPQTATVQACATVAPSVCTTVPLSIAATTVTLSPGSVPGPLTAGKTQGFSATIQNPGIANQLTWTPTPTGAAAGTLTSATTAITGSATAGISGTATSPANTYTAPNPITTPESVTLRVCMSVNALICATPVTIQLPGFSVTATQIGSATGLSLGHSISYTIAVTALDGFNGTVTLSVGGLPAGVTPTFSTQSIATSGTATLTLISAYSTSTYIGSSTVTVTGSSGSMANSASFALITRPLQYKGDCGVK